MAKLEVEMEVRVQSEKMIDAFADLTKSLVAFAMAFDSVIDVSKQLSESIQKLEKSKMTIEVQSKDKLKAKWWQFWKWNKKIKR